MTLDFLAPFYLWTKTLHVVSVITWMAGLFYLPRLFVYHAEMAGRGSEPGTTFKVMERKLLQVIMNPAMVATWVFGLLLVFTPGVVDFTTDLWAWVKAAGVLAMTWYHHLLVRWRRDFDLDRNTRPGRFYRQMNEVPTLLMLVIVTMVIVRPF